MPRTVFNPLDWYWVIASDRTQAWSSARVQYVPTTSDTAYQAWLADTGLAPTVMAAAGDLVGVILGQWVPVVSAAGVAVTCTSDDTLSGTYGIDPQSLVNITSIAAGIAAGKPLPSGSDTFKYRDITGASHLFSGPAFLSFGSAIETYVYSFQDAVEELILGNAATLPIQPVTFG